MKAQSKNRKSPTCSRCRFHGERDVRVLQHKCPFKDCSCSDCLLVKKRSNIYRAQKNLDKSDENSNEVSSPGSGSTGSSRCLGSPQIPMHPGNMGDSNEPSLQNPWSTNHQQPPPPPPQLQQAPSQQQLQQQLQHQQPPVPPPPSLVVPPPQPHQMPPSSMNSIPPNKNIGYSNIKNFHELCLTFPDHSPPQLQTLFEQCGNDYEKTIDKILMSKWYSETSSSNNDYQQQQSLPNDPNYINNHNNNTNSTNNNINNNMNHNNTNSTTTNNHNSSNHNHNHHHNHNHNTNHNNNINSNNTNHNNLEYPPTNEDDTRLSFANCHYNQQQPQQQQPQQQQQQQPQQQPQPQQPPPSQRMMTAPNFNNQDYTGDELVNRSIQPHNTDAMASDWSYGDTNRYSMATTNYPNNNNNNTWTQGDYPNWSNASSNFWPSNGHNTYSYVDQNDANAMSYYYGSRREMDYPDPSGHLDRTVKPEIGPNISSNYDFDAY